MKNFFNKKKNNNHKGFSVVEVLIACMIISTTILALMSAASKGIELSQRALKQVQASLLIEEGVEAVKSIRDNSWNNISGLTLNTNYYLTFNTNTNTWSLGTTPTAPLDGNFTRIITLQAVNRDSNDDIASTGTLDSGTKEVKVVVSWPSRGETLSRNISFYLTNIFN